MSDCEGCPDSISLSEVETQLPTLETVIQGLPTGTTVGPLPELVGVTCSHIWAVDMGSTAEAHLAQIPLTVSKGYDRIIGHPDGSLEYKKGPSDFESPGSIDGYERDPENQWLFHPLWESCSWRHYTSILKQNCQCIDVLAKCSANDHWVKYEDCLRCQSRLPIADKPAPQKKTRATLRQPDLDHSSK